MAPKAAPNKSAISSANTVTKDFLLFSEPFLHEGALLSSSVSGRRLYIHHLSEVPISEVFTTRVGNQLQRIDKVEACRHLAPPRTLARVCSQAHGGAPLCGRLDHALDCVVLRLAP